MVGQRLFLFGGTSPYHGPPLYFTPEQLALLPIQEEDNSSKLMVITVWIETLDLNSLLSRLYIYDRNKEALYKFCYSKRL